MITRFFKQTKILVNIAKYLYERHFIKMKVAKIQRNKSARELKSAKEHNDASKVVEKNEVSQKRTRSAKNGSSPSPVACNVKAAKPLWNASVKRKIDFGKEKSDEQVNNNATRNSTIENKEHREHKTRKSDGNKIPDNEFSKVKWTHEFMEKVRCSNNKFKTKQEQAKVDKARKQGNSCHEQINEHVDLLQVKGKAEVGDGIDTLVECKMVSEVDEDLLDYEDDLSDLEVKDITGSARKEQPQPETSQATAPSQEKNLMENPIMQQMMKQFFQEQFKDLKMEMQKQQTEILAQKGNVNNGNQDLVNQTDGLLKQSRCGNESTIKSPSDMTVYVPALQKKLAPDGMVGVRMVAQVPGVELPPDPALSRVLIHRNEEGIDTFNQNGLISDFVETVRIQQHPEDEV